MRVESLFGALGVDSDARRNADAYRLCEIFAALLAMPDEDVMEVLAYAMAETLEAGGPVVEAVLNVCETDLSAYWKPEPVFFDLCRDKRAINAMVADIGSQSLAESCAKDAAKLQKSIIADRIKGEGCEANPEWRPGWMQRPPTRIVEGAGSPPADAWGRIAHLFDVTEAGSACNVDTLAQPDAA